MQKQFFLLLALLVSAQLGWSIDQSYYATINNTQGATLRDNLYSITIAGPKDMSYAKLWSAYKVMDVYPEDSIGKAGKIWDMYSNVLYTPGTNQCGSYSNVGSCYNREHSLPKSWFDDDIPAYYDLGHIVPTDGYVNNQRSNYSFGECANGTRLKYDDKIGKGKLGASTFPGCSLSNVFEPDDEYKGDFARMYMYMVVRYKKGNINDITLTSDHGSEMFNSTDANFGFTAYSVSLLMKWHRLDPVSRKEVDRNNGMEAQQSNRNPFIDYPILAEYLWGNRQSETFTFDKAMASFDPDFIWGVSDGSRDGAPVDPPTPAVKYGVNWSINGETALVDSIGENQSIAALPPLPVSCSTESTEFMGWTTEAIEGSRDDAPAVLYTAVADFPAVTADVTYYAVFAKKETQSSGSVAKEETLSFPEAGIGNGVAVTQVEAENFTVTCSKADGANPPKYYSSGGAVRFYPGNTMDVDARGEDITKIVLTFGSSDTSNPISVNTGSFATDTWTGKATSVLFTFGGSSGNRRVATVAVTINGEGAVTTYSRYITSCQTPTELVETVAETVTARKLLIGGQIYLQVGEQLFTITGQQLR